MKKYLYKFGIYPLRLYWFLFRPNGYGVKCVIQRPDSKVLFIKNTYGKGYWNFPGGHINRSETAEEAVKREVFEEVGIILDSVTLVVSFLSTLEHKRDHIAVFTAYTEAPVGSVQKSEIADFQWCHIDDYPKPLSGVAKMVLNRLPKPAPRV